MPATMRAVSLVGVPEVIDGSNPIEEAGPDMSTAGFALKARASAVATFPPFGPPDMLYVRKKYIPVVGPTKLYGYYHFVRGVETSHVASISAYIVDVVRNKGLDPLPWVSAGGWEIASATFVAYNIISKADAIVHVDFPGSTTASALAQDGTPIDLSERFWGELLVSSTVRDVAGAGEMPLYPCLRVITPFTSLRVEPLFLDAASQCVDRWHLSGIGTLDGVTDSAARSRMASALRAYFLSNSRYDAAIDFFMRESVGRADPECGVHAAAAARMKGDLEKATAIIDYLIDGNADCGLGWMERAHIFRTKGELPEALEAAKTASRSASDIIDVWVDLADLHVDLKQYPLALEALNGADMPPPSLDPFLRELVPNRKNVTMPLEGASQGTDAVRVLANRFREERNKSNDKTDDALSELPGKLMTEAEHRCYGVLVKILNDLSWDEMLAVRGECFVMESDVENERNSESGEDGDSAESGTLEGSEDSGDGGSCGSEGRDLEEPTGENGDPSETHPEGSTQAAEAANGFAAISLDDDDDDKADDDGDEGSWHAANGSAGAGAAELRVRSLEKIGKRVCKPWLDYLVTNMYKDLRAMAVWNAEEQQHSAAAALRAANLARKSQGDIGEGETAASPSSRSDIEGQAAETDYRRSADEVVSTTKRPPADWLRRGELALRLGKTEEAKTAFWTCVKLSAKEKVVAVTALNRIMGLSSDDGDIRATLKCADAIWNYIDSATDRKSSSEPTSAVPEVRTAVFRLISKKGLRAVRDVLTSRVIELDRKRIEALLLDSVALQVDGFSR